jgi:hypothetical protein
MSAVVIESNAPAASMSTSTEDLIGSVARISQGMRAHVVDAVDRMSEINRSVHLLSMNARVEASRAGASGAGFSVVAQELTRLSSGMKDATAGIVRESRQKGTDLDAVLQLLNEDVVARRLCDLAYNAIDIVDRNLYERSCDVRWWATEPAVAECLKDPSPDNIAYASRRLGQILDSYTVYADLVIADAQGRIVANGRPSQFQSVGANVAASEWFTTAMAKRRPSEYGFESMHNSKLVNKQSALVFSCAVRDPDSKLAPTLGVLGIIFNWKALGQTVVEQIPLLAAERSRTRAVLVDEKGRILADTMPQLAAITLDFPERLSMFRGKRGVVATQVGGRSVLVCHAASPGFETYRTGWHALLLREVD